MDDLIDLSARLERAAAGIGAAWLRRVVVVQETASTQDSARDLAKGVPGLVVVAGRQTSGRGRLGRQWADTSHLGLAMTLVLDARAWKPERLSVAAGVAACRAIEAALGGSDRAGLRWPNDVVERRPDGAPGRKLAGVLIEREGAIALLGIGINVLQQRGDWPEDLAGSAASLRELGSARDRAGTAEAVIEELHRALGTDDATLGAEWTVRDVLIGRRAVFLHDGVEYRGRVEAIEPTSQIRLTAEDGRVVRLPALTTSLLREVDPASPR
jgi:BirA family biotin operon repressor/biotin-[acetyl-CoA-carboxylase] ligase